jgi:hypothetical protein
LLFSEPMTAVDRRRPQFMGDGYNFPAFTTMSIMQAMVALPMSAYIGSKVDKPSRAKIHLCPLWSNSGQTQRRLDCPLCAISGLMHRSKTYYSITSSAATIRPAGGVKPRALAVLRLRTVSYFVGVWTGRSLGLAPRRIRSAYNAACR